MAARFLADRGGLISLYNRSEWRARMAEEILEMPCNPLNELELSAVDVLVNTIPIPESADSHLPFSFSGLDGCLAVIDYTYGPRPNFLVIQCHKLGIKIVDGMVMLQKQLRSQFQCLTGIEIQEHVVADALNQYFQFPGEMEQVDEFEVPEAVELAVNQ